MQHAAMPLTREELDHIATSTLAHYDERAEDYWQGTCDHDVSQNIATLLRYIETAAPLSILDLGCGPGRDLKTFSELGHKAIGLEGAPQVAALARVGVARCVITVAGRTSSAVLHSRKPAVTARRHRSGRSLTKLRFTLYCVRSWFSHAARRTVPIL